MAGSSASQILLKPLRRSISSRLLSTSTESSPHYTQARQRRPPSLSHVADAGGATRAATLRAIELTKTRREQQNANDNSSSRTVNGRGGGGGGGGMGEGGLGGLLAKRRKAQGVVWDQDAKEISAFSAAFPTGNDNRRESGGRSASTHFDTVVEQRSSSRFANASPRSTFRSTESQQQQQQQRSPRPSSGPRAPRQQGGGGGGGPQRARPRTASSDRSNRSRAPVEDLPVTPLIAPSTVKVPSLNISDLISSHSTSNFDPSLIQQSQEGTTSTDRQSALGELQGDYSRYLDQASSMSSKEGKKEQVLDHARGLLNRNPSVGIEQRDQVLKKVEEVLSK